MAAGKPAQQHKKHAGKAPATVATVDMNQQLEEEDLLKGVDMTHLYRSAPETLYFLEVACTCLVMLFAICETLCSFEETTL